MTQTATRQNAAAGAARTGKGTADDIAAQDAAAEAKQKERYEQAKARRAAKREAYPVTVLTLKLHKAAQQRDVVEAMLAAAKTWAEPHSYVVSASSAQTREKTGVTAQELVIDTPESFAAKARVKGDPDKTRETAKAIAGALRSDNVKAKAAELGVAPKDLVLTALAKQFGIEVEL